MMAREFLPRKLTRKILGLGRRRRDTIYLKLSFHFPYPFASRELTKHKNLNENALRVFELMGLVFFRIMWSHLGKS